MAVTPISITALPAAAGYNLTDSADFTTMTAGAGNGVQFTFDAKDLIILKNPTGGNAVYTFKTQKQPSGYAGYSLTVSDATITVATTDTHLIRANEIFADTSNKVTVECDVAGEIMVLNL